MVPDQFCVQSCVWLTPFCYASGVVKACKSFCLVGGIYCPFHLWLETTVLMYMYLDCKLTALIHPAL